MAPGAGEAVSASARIVSYSFICKVHSPTRYHFTCRAADPSAVMEELRWGVQIAATGSYISRVHKLAPLCALIFKRSSAQHPLIAGALGECLNATVGHRLSLALASSMVFIRFSNAVCTRRRLRCVTVCCPVHRTMRKPDCKPVLCP